MLGSSIQDSELCEEGPRFFLNSLTLLLFVNNILAERLELAFERLELQPSKLSGLDSGDPG